MFYVPADRIDEAWEGGACRLAEACARADGDMTGGQLLGELKAGRKTLIGHDGAWAAVEIQVYPNRRALHIEAVYAPGKATSDVFDQLAEFGRHNGCDVIQGACQPAVARLWKRRFGFKEAFTIVRKTI